MPTVETAGTHQQTRYKMKLRERYKFFFKKLYSKKIPQNQYLRDFKSIE